MSIVDLEIVKTWAKSYQRDPGVILYFLFTHKKREDVHIKFAMAGIWFAANSPEAVV